MKTNFLTAFLLFAGTVVLSAQTPDKAKLDSYMDALGSNHKFMGTLSLSKNGSTVYTKSTGFLDAANKIPIKENTKFRIGSISKTFTAALIFKAIEEKKLTLDTKLNNYYPAVPNASKITLRHLLGHRSGIHNFTSDAAYYTWNNTPKTEAQMLEIITKGGSDFEPDTKANYSNANYVLLSYILEKTYKKPYKELLEKYIIKPLQLKNTYFGNKIDTGNNEANSYTFIGEWKKETETHTSIPMGAGGIVSTTTDLSRFIEALFEGKIVSAASLEQMMTIANGYGLGLLRFPFDGKTAYGHTGGIDGFTSIVLYFPEDKITYSFTANASNYDNNSIGIAALSWIYNKPFDIPDFSLYTYTPEDLDKYLGNYTSDQMPLQINVTKNNSTLMAQATGQSAFPLDAGAEHVFRFEKANIVMEFNPDKKQMVLKQGGRQYIFTKA